MENINARLEPLASRSFVRLARETCTCVSLSQNETELLHMNPCKTTTVHKIYDADHKGKHNFLNWHRQIVYAGEIDPHTRLLTGKTLFRHSGYVKMSQ